MAIDKTKIYDIIDIQKQDIRETVLETPANSLVSRQDLLPYPRDPFGKPTVNHRMAQLAIREAGGELSTYNFPDALRMGIRFDVFTAYNEAPVTWPLFCREVPSNKQQEEYKNDTGMGILPIVPEGKEYSMIAVGDGPGVIIRNYKRGGIVPVTEEMRRFDQLGIVREQSDLMGRAARFTEEQTVMDVLTTTTNYTRNSTTGDNDGGANTQTLTFSPEGLIEAFQVLRTMKDRHSGMYLGVMPNTAIIAPQLEWALRQLLSSAQMNGMGDKDATVVYGQGMTNPFQGFIQRVIVSPQFGSTFEWALLEANRAIYFQRVDPIDVMLENPSTSDMYLERDIMRYRVRDWFGVGMRDDRYAFFSDSTTKPTIN